MQNPSVYKITITMQIEYIGPIKTIWPHVDGLVTFEQQLENMGNNSWRQTWTIP